MNFKRNSVSSVSSCEKGTRDLPLDTLDPILFSNFDIRISDFLLAARAKVEYIQGDGVRLFPIKICRPTRRKLYV